MNILSFIRHYSKQPILFTHVEQIVPAGHYCFSESVLREDSRIARANMITPITMEESATLKIGQGPTDIKSLT